MKSNKSIARNFFGAEFHFLQFQKWPKINYWTGKKFKTAKNAISLKIFFGFIWFHEFFAWTFLNFLARCVSPKQSLQNLLEITLKFVKKIIPNVSAILLPTYIGSNMLGWIIQNTFICHDKTKLHESILLLFYLSEKYILFNN